MNRRWSLLALLLLAGCASNSDKVSLPAVDGTSKTLSPGSFPAKGAVDRVGTYAPLTTTNMSVPAADITISGWAVDERSLTPAGGVDIAIDGNPYRAEYGQDRPDVAQLLGAPSCVKSGYTFVLHGSQFSKGRHTVVVRVVSADKTSFAEMTPLILEIQ